MDTQNVLFLSLLLLIPQLIKTKFLLLKDTCYIRSMIFFLTRPSFKILRGVFFLYKGSIDVKSVLTFEKWSLVSELKSKM